MAMHMRTLTSSISRLHGGLDGCSVLSTMLVTTAVDSGPDASGDGIHWLTAVEFGQVVGGEWIGQHSDSFELWSNKWWWDWPTAIYELWSGWWCVVVMPWDWLTLRRL